MTSVVGAAIGTPIDDGVRLCVHPFDCHVAMPAPSKQLRRKELICAMTRSRLDVAVNRTVDADVGTSVTADVRAAVNAPVGAAVEICRG